MSFIELEQLFKLIVQVVLQLLIPLKSLTSILEVAELFKSAEEDRKQVQEKVAAEMDI